MTGQIGIIYSTVDGQTLKICKALANHLQERHQNVRLFSIEAFNLKVSDFDVLVIGASVLWKTQRPCTTVHLGKQTRTGPGENGIFFQ